MMRRARSLAHCGRKRRGCEAEIDALATQPGYTDWLTTAAATRPRDR